MMGYIARVAVVAMLILGIMDFPRAVSTQENECVIHPLKPEVIEQLLAAANASLRQNDLLQVQERNSTDVPSLKELLNLGASPDLITLLLHTMERELARHDSQISILMKKTNIAGGHEEASRSNINCQQSQSRLPETVLEAVIKLQRDVSLLQERQSVSAATQPQRDSVANLHLQTHAAHNTECYPIDKWPHDCYDIAQQGKNESGVYTIYPFRCRRSERGVRVWCDIEGDQDNKWTVVLSRRPLEQQVNFNNGWRDYRLGFGDPETEHWIGNNVLHELTIGRPQTLRVDMADWDGNQRYAEYYTFIIEDEDAEYRLHLGQYTGNAGNSFSRHDNMLFTTTDRDNDLHETVNCATDYKGGFWFKKCHTVSPTNLLLEKRKSALGINWASWYSDRTTLKEISFKLKPKPCPMN